MSVYFITNGRGLVKIGFSDTPEKRLSSLQCATADKLSMYALFDGDREHEKFVQDLLAKSWVHGEWYYFDESVIAIKNRLDTVGWAGIGYNPQPKAEFSEHQETAVTCAWQIRSCDCFLGMDAEDTCSSVDQNVLWKFLYRPSEPLVTEYESLLRGVLQAAAGVRATLDEMEKLARSKLDALDCIPTKVTETEARMMAAEAELNAAVLAAEAVAGTEEVKNV